MILKLIDHPYNPTSGKSNLLVRSSSCVFPSKIVGNQNLILSCFEASTYPMKSITTAQFQILCNIIVSGAESLSSNLCLTDLAPQIECDFKGLCGLLSKVCIEARHRHKKAPH